MTTTRDLTATRAAVRWAWAEHVAPAMRRPSPSALLAALVTADTAVDAVLLAEGRCEASTSERIWAARRSFSNYEALRAARHLRHQAVHQIGFSLSLRACAPALAAYARALLDHGVDLDVSADEGGESGRLSGSPSPVAEGHARGGWGVRA